LKKITQARRNKRMGENKKNITHQIKREDKKPIKLL
jgi:hypothetical protein